MNEYTFMLFYVCPQNSVSDYGWSGFTVFDFQVFSNLSLCHVLCAFQKIYIFVVYKKNIIVHLYASYLLFGIHYTV